VVFDWLAVGRLDADDAPDWLDIAPSLRAAFCFYFLFIHLVEEPAAGTSIFIFLCL